jgi:hypothetical protein
MSDVTSHYIVRPKSVTVSQYESLRSVLKVPSTSIDSIRTILDMTIFDDDTNILKGMYSIRFNGRSDPGDTSARPDTGRSDHGEAPARPPRDPFPPLINSLTVRQPDKFRTRKERGSKEKEIVSFYL